METDKILEFSTDTINKVTRDLNLPKVSIAIDNRHCDSVGIRGRENSYKIFINQFFVDNISTCEAFEFIRESNTFNTDKKRLLFVLLHEIGHLIQEVRHKKWMAYNNINNFLLIRLSSEEYRETKLERNADKIALILFKKYVLTLDK